MSCARVPRVSAASRLVVWSTAGALALASSVRADDAPIAGALAVLGDLDAEAALRAARVAGGATFRAVSITTPAPSPPPDLVAPIESAYVDGDFARCLGLLAAPRTEQSWIEPAGRADAARSLILRAACGLGADEPELARRALEELFVGGLDRASLAATTPELQALAEDVAREIAARPRHALSIVSRPGHATVWVDGREHGTTPLSVDVVAGHHHITLTRLGSTDREAEVDIVDAARLSLALDPATADELALQLEQAVSSGAPDRAELGAAASDAWGSRVVVFVFRREGRVRAALWDRELERFAVRSDADTVDDAVRLAVTEWRSVVEPRSLLEEPAFWITTLAVAGLASVLTVLLAQPPEQHFAIEAR